MNETSLTERFNIKPKTSQPGQRIRVAVTRNPSNEFGVQNNLFNTERQDIFTPTIDELEENSKIHETNESI